MVREFPCHSDLKSAKIGSEKRLPTLDRREYNNTSKKGLTMNKKQIFIIWLISFYLIYIYFEGKDLIKPSQFDEPTSQIPFSPIFLTQPTIVGTASLPSGSVEGWNLTSNSIPIKPPLNIAYLVASGTVIPLMDIKSNKTNEDK